MGETFTILRILEPAGMVKNPRKNKVRAVFMLVAFGIVFLFVKPLCAQNTREIPDMPVAKSDHMEPAAEESVGGTTRNSQRPLTFHERLKIYEHSFTKPENLLGPLMGAGVGQARNTPPEWGQGAGGFAQRLASGYGRSVISRTIALGVASVDHEDSRFFPSNETRIWRRTRHAVVGTFVSRTTDGGTMLAYSRFVGVYGAAFIANAWEPPSQKDTLHALERGSTALLSSVGWHVFEEFWPDIRRAIRHKQN